MESDLALRDIVGVQDAVLLEDISSESVFIENLEKRFKENLIYTYIGPVLISVNPYKDLGIYSAEAIEKYRNVNFFEVPPHVYAVTDTALRAMRGENADQCILISGESGSGKTEASKKILQFIASTVRSQKVVQVVKEKLLQSNPVLEAFGNAKTNRNTNSSRFGKYMDTEFNNMGDPVGGHILNYLLEKSRVVYQAKGERNFHIFYQLLAGADDALLASLHLQRDPAQYFYLNQGQSSVVKQIDDAKDFKVVSAAMKVMDLDETEVGAIFKIVATIIHLGNVKFEDQDGRARVASTKEVETIAKLLDCSPDAIENALLHKTIDARGDVVTSPLTRDEALYARDALAKAVYGRLFDWLVQKLNESLAKTENQKTVVVGILDIYGFEIFERNSFEQFCINYCNEKLQQLFIELTLKSEQEEYLREGIQWEPVAYFDNKIIVDLIEEKHKGIIAILDEECLRPGDSTDATFLAKMNKQLASHPHFVSHVKSDNKGRKTIERDEFRLVHYAGEVTYSVSNFLDKNNDLLFRDLKEAMSNANNMIAKETFPKSELSNKKRPDTAASQFRTSLTQLSVILKSKEPSYIRCIKPNDDQGPNKFNRDIVSHQVKYLGLMENLRVRRAGFAYRRPYEGFLNRYKSLCPETWPHPKVAPKEAVQLLVNHLNYGKDDYRMGKTKIFIRLPRTLFETEDAFQKRKNELLAKIQAVWKGRRQRLKYLHIRKCVIKVQANIRRFLAVRKATKRKWAVVVVRKFITGFISRNETPSEANLRFLHFVRYQYLLRLTKQLPQSVLRKDDWPAQSPKCCEETSEILRKLHLRWLVRRYIRTLPPERKRMIELKILAESLFDGKKKGYQETVTVWFKTNRLTNEQTTVFKSGFESGAKPPAESTIYVCPVTKYDRHGYKPRERILAITSSALYLLDAKDGKVKHRLAFKQLVTIRVTKMKDGLVLVTIPEELKKDKGDLILSCEFIFEALTFLIDTAKNNDLLAIEDASSITHRMIDGKEGVIELTTNGGTTGIMKGKNGHLIVVSQ